MTGSGVPPFDLFHVTLGQGPPMVLLHGGLGLDHTYLRPDLDTLADVAELVYLDLRGNGRSPEPVDWSQVDHSTWVEDVERLRIHLGHERLIVFGHSYGGYFAQEYALAFPERVLGLVLCDTAPAADHADVVQANALARATPEQLEILAEAFTRPFEGDADAFWRTYRAILPLYFHRPTPDVLDRVSREIVCRPAAFNRAYLECRPHFDTRDRLGQIAAPTLVLAGRHDWITPPEQGAERLHAGIPGSELVVFEKSGHFPFVEESERFRRVMRSWLARPFLRMD